MKQYLVVSLLVAAASACTSASSTTSSTSSSSGSIASSSSAGSSTSTGSSGSSSLASSSTEMGSSSSFAGSSSSAAPANTTCETAILLENRVRIEQTLGDPATSKRYFAIDVTAGQGVIIETGVPSFHSIDDPTVIDPVITVRDASGTVIAQNDDPNPRLTRESRLATMAVTTERWCVEFAHCTAIFGAAVCPPVDEITDRGFEIGYGAFGSDDDTGVELDIEPNNTPETAGAIEFVLNPSTVGNFYGEMLFGQLPVDDVDLFKADIPANVYLGMGTSAVLSIEPQAMGPAGNGSTLESVTIEVAPFAMPDAVIARLTTSSASFMWAPIAVGSSYVVRVTGPAGNAMPGARPIYTFGVRPDYTTRVEAELAGMATNNTPETAESPMPEANTGTWWTGFLADATDVDIFRIALPDAGPGTLRVFCGSAIHGSGLMGLTVDALDVTGMALPGTASAVENADGATINDVTTPMGATHILVKVSATGVAPDVSSRLYQCNVQRY